MRGPEPSLRVATGRIRPLPHTEPGSESDLEHGRFPASVSSGGPGETEVRKDDNCISDLSTFFLSLISPHLSTYLSIPVFTLIRSWNLTRTTVIVQVSLLRR